MGMKNGGPNGAKVEILLIEDNPEQAGSAQNVLKKANICNKVTVLNDAQEALEYVWRTGSYNKLEALPSETLVLLSLNLKSMHGLDLLRKFRGDERTKTVPVIILTSSQEERGVMQSYKLGAAGCIVKPMDLQKFIEAVAELRLGWLLIDQKQNES